MRKMLFLVVQGVKKQSQRTFPMFDIFLLGHLALQITAKDHGYVIIPPHARP